MRSLTLLFHTTSLSSVCILHLQHLSIRICSISSAQSPHVLMIPSWTCRSGKHTPNYSHWSLLKEMRIRKDGRCDPGLPIFLNSLFSVSFEFFTPGLCFILTLQFFIKAITSGKKMTSQRDCEHGVRSYEKHL